MSSTLRISQPPPDWKLAALRAELDRLDDAVHDLLMRRAEVVEQVASLGVKGRVPMRPGREASIIRRLLGRHAGRLPPEGVVRVWRELICAHTSLQRPLLVAVCDRDGSAAWAAAAREHFGALTPLRVQPSPDAALHDVAAGAVSAAVLPLPATDDPPEAAWWTALLDDPGLHVVARLPFWAPRPEGAPAVQALVVSAAKPDPSGQDRSLLAFAPAPGTDAAAVAAALDGAGFDAGSLVLRHSAGILQALVDVNGFVADGDPRLLALPAGTRVLGAYAVPVGSLP